MGIGLSQLFSASDLEVKEVGKDTELANSMGLFLQKTNIIRDYLEDITEGRVFWPKTVSLTPPTSSAILTVWLILSLLHTRVQNKKKQF